MCLKSVCRRSQNAVSNSCSQSPREMALTDRILPRYFLSRDRVSIRPRFLYTPKKTWPNQPAARSHASAPPTVRTAQFETQIIPSRQVATYVRGGRLWMILLAPMQNHPSLRKSYPRCNDPAKRGSVGLCEAFEKKPLPLALTLLLRYRYRATRPTGQKLRAIIANRPIDWANGERVGDPGKLSRHGRFPGHAGSYSDNVIYHAVL